MAGFLGGKVRYDLMTIEIEVDPFIGRASLRTTQQFTIKRAGGRKAVNGKGEVKRWHGGFSNAHDDGSRSGKGLRRMTHAHQIESVYSLK
jgi:hypothetical protein